MCQKSEGMFCSGRLFYVVAKTAAEQLQETNAQVAELGKNWRVTTQTCALTMDRKNSEIHWKTCNDFLVAEEFWHGLLDAHIHKNE